jgi:undecaprenyl-diphosphatase
MVSFVETVILGILQGLTEWFPVSSSGHLALAKELLGWQPPVIFYVLLHLGTVAVVIAYFRKDILIVLRAMLRRDFNAPEGRLAIFIVLGSVPTAFVGYAFKGIFESFFSNLLVVGLALLTTGILLFISARREGSKTLGYLDSLLVGLAQGIAIIPGVSRSGATISTGLLRGVDRMAVFKFSFLLSIPAILGATVMESGDLSLLLSSVDTEAVVLGVLASMVVGYLSLKALQRIILTHKFNWFAVYCLAAGTVVIISQIF